MAEGDELTSGAFLTAVFKTAVVRAEATQRASRLSQPERFTAKSDSFSTFLAMRHTRTPRQAPARSATRRTRSSMLRDGLDVSLAIELME